MNNSARKDSRNGKHYTATGPARHEYQPARTQLIRAAPSAGVVAAAEYLLIQPDAYLYRRRYLELIAHTSEPDGTRITDYQVAERYLLVTAAALDTAHRRATRECRSVPGDVP